MTDKLMRRNNPGGELAEVFERMMQQLLLLGHTLPESAVSLTPQQLKILFTLDVLSDPTPMSKVSAQLGVTPSTLTKVAGGLIGLGCLQRQRAADDDRVVNVSLTARGRQLVAEIKAYRRGFFRSVCARLTASECRKLIESHRHIYETYRGVLRERNVAQGSGARTAKTARRGANVTRGDRKRTSARRG
jgi:DNA-binding MarR family transcriptional regulator